MIPAQSDRRSVNNTLIPEACVNCKYFALQPTGTSCSGFITIKVGGKATSRKQKRPKNCPLRECE